MPTCLTLVACRLNTGGGHSLIRSDRYVPPVRAGFWTRNPLKAGMNIDSIKVKTGLKVKTAGFSTVKTGF